jgi:dephospho-CoA kinase
LSACKTVRNGLRLGLTGGIGSGKSTVAQMLQALGAGLIDADAIARASTAPGGVAMGAIRTVFGAEFLNTAGALDRDKMRALAFSDASAKHKLEAIIHPLVGQEIESQFQAAQAAGRACVVFDIPLLAESGHWRGKLDRILVVDCLVSTQISRTVDRSQLPEATVQQIIQAQASRAQRLALADAVIYNQDLSLDELRQQVEQIAPHFGL